MPIENGDSEHLRAIVDFSAWRRRPFLGLLADLDSHDLSIEQDVHRTLLIHALFGYRIFVSDRFLLSHPSAIALLKDEGSLLREMFATKYATLVTTTTNRQDLMDLADKIEYFQEDEDALEVWRRFAGYSWERGDVVGMPRNCSEIGFYDVDGVRGGNDPNSVEFRKYSKIAFDEMTSFEISGDFPLSASRMRQRNALNNQIGSYRSEIAANLLAGISTETSPGTTFETSDSQDLLTTLFEFPKFWNEPLIYVNPEILRTNLGVFKKFADSYPSKINQLKLEYAGDIFSALTTGSDEGIAKLRERIINLTERYLSALSSPNAIQGSHLFLKSGRSTSNDWQPISMRETLSAILSASGTNDVGSFSD